MSVNITVNSGIQLLVDEGADVTIKDENGFTPKETAGKKSQMQAYAILSNVSRFRKSDLRVSLLLDRSI